jgi:hypothetical protein
MKPQVMFAVAALVLGLGSLGAKTQACRFPEPESRYVMEILVDGRPLPRYGHEGTNYVEALKGREYAIRLTNRTGERVAVALAVDGLNSIDAKHTSARDARKWILAPFETVTLSGWQTSSGTARRFVFTSEKNSYGAWLGRTSDLGVISAAFFREVRRYDRDEIQGATPDSRLKRDSVEGAAEAPAASAAAPLEKEQRAKSSAKDELAATGIGREIEHRVRRVDFDAEDSAAATVTLRYEYHDALVRLGVLPAVDDALARRERARGFDDGFAPDPYRSGR